MADSSFSSARPPLSISALDNIILDINKYIPIGISIGIFNAGWIRLEFRANDERRGQIRIYVLADDVGRSVIDRNVISLRKTLVSLLLQLDISSTTWHGAWDDDTPFCHLDSSLDTDVKENPSLFQIFNNLPSPKPDPELVTDPYAKDSMYRILDSRIDGLKTTMHHYQRRSAALMLQRESKPAQNLDPRLRHLKDQKGNSWYCDVDAGFCFREPRTYEAARGGICAETMGLGKTLICLGLIVATKDSTSQIPLEYSFDSLPVREKTGSLMNMAAATLTRISVPWKTELANLEARECFKYERCREALRKNVGYYMLPSPIPRRESRNPINAPPRKILLSAATIIVVPANLIQQWQHEIKKHTSGLNVLVMKTMSEPLPKAEVLGEYDIILFTKQRFDKEATDEVDDLELLKEYAAEFARPGLDLSQPTLRNVGRAGRSAGRQKYAAKKAYHSPLKELHFKRLIVDEGHTFGNASSSSRTDATVVVDFLHLDARWIISGTPTRGLYGAEVAINYSETQLRSRSQSLSNTLGPAHDVLSDALDPATLDSFSKMLSQESSLYHKQERKDIEKLGNIATFYLKAKPWANRLKDHDHASWSHLVMQPRHGPKSHGSSECLRATLEGMIIRHRSEDVLLEVSLPPLSQKLVFLDGSIQNKLSLNTFVVMIITNAVTSERKDADYFFHPHQRKSLQQVVSNLRQASFFWSGFETEGLRTTVGIAKTFLEEKKVAVSTEDEILLREAIRIGEVVLANEISQAISKFHEMPMYIQNNLPDDTRAAWSLDGKSSNPALMGATMVHVAQKFVESQLWKEDPSEGLEDAGKQAMKSANNALEPQNHRPAKRKSTKDMSKAGKKVELVTSLAGGVTTGDSSGPRKRARPSPSPRKKSKSSTNYFLINFDAISDNPAEEAEDDSEATQAQRDAQVLSVAELKSSLKKTTDISGSLSSSSPLSSAAIISTASAKLSYLMDAIMTHQAEEKIIIFYEADNTAYYIAQALECLSVKHLIYAKTLSSARRSQYVVTFNQSPHFRVLMMDVSQAAFGLDLSSASRVYFVNPVFSPQVEAQAVKRAHRIGQTKPVFVETLVLRGSIEELLVERRKRMSTEEHNSCKSILDDRTVYDWVRDVRFIDAGLGSEDAEGVRGPEQMAKLAVPRLVFGRGAGMRVGDPDADLIVGDSLMAQGKGKTKAGVSFSTIGVVDDKKGVVKGKTKASMPFQEISKPAIESNSTNLPWKIEDRGHDEKPAKKRSGVSFAGEASGSGNGEDPSIGKKVRVS
ncbi:hypothetical protein QTJ16_006602 [Diplocarpon rosae]|uniref:Helicase C-terminal domain-containing protein n=1 Tax=Diplocarpon rosae TaxID=946125 RepID=A0AAD9SVL4_9HELO|nr:hypothetical protein QTJ16_006602 [Diplocarpon rosae]